MTLLTNAYENGVHAALEKLGATRGVREIRKAMGAGDLGRANRLAQTPGLLSPTNTAGTQLQDLGRGGEGLATLVAHPQHGVSVRKMYDPTGSVYSPEIIARKEQLGSLPGAAQFLGTAKTKQNTPMHFNEYVPGTTPQANDPRLLAAQQKMQGQGYVRGLHMKDLRDANAKLTPSGEVKFIDYAPFEPHELTPNHVAETAATPHVMPVTPAAGQRLFGGAQQARTSTPAHLQSAEPGMATHALAQRDLPAARARFAEKGQMYNNAFKQHMLGGQTPAAPVQAPIAPAPAPAQPQGHWIGGPPSAPPPPMGSGSLSSAFSSAPMNVTPSQNPMVSAPTRMPPSQPGTVSLRGPR